MRNSVIKKNRKVYIFKHQQTSSGGGGGGADLENNKTATIDVSTYTGPVAINPSSGKDGMKKATVTLENIPSPSGTPLYIWDFKGILPASTFEEVTVGMTVLFSDDNSSDLWVGEITEINTEENTASYTDTSGTYFGQISSNSSVTALSDIPF